MTRTIHRRDVLKCTAIAALGLAREPGLAARETAARRGVVIGHPEGAKAGTDVLAAGGNAVDAAVSAALVAGVVGVHLCGIGGYGGHMVIATADGKKVTAIDFNSTAPAAARDDMYPLTAKGEVIGGINNHGWLAAGVPGTLAGLQLAIDRFGTKPFSTLVKPAIQHAREGFPVTKGLAGVLRTARARLQKDPGSARLFFVNGEPLSAGGTYRNPDLAAMLQALADENNVASFYRGPIAMKIAAGFATNGGLVTAADLAAYTAREVEPLRLEWNGCTICTAPLTAGGHSVLEALAILRALHWPNEKGDSAQSTHLRLEALRLVWQDRLRSLGDPEKANVPWRELLASKHIEQLAQRVKEAVGSKRPASGSHDGRRADGTIHISAADASGMMVALTLTHGGSLGAQVTVAGLGLILGHGMSRFEPRPGHPNSPGPGKRPLHNMCPTIVLREGKPVLAVGGTGGRKIPNAVFDVLAQYVGCGATIDTAVKAGRMNTEGNLEVTLDPRMPAADADYLQSIGYTVKRGPAATIQAVGLAAGSNEFVASAR